MRANGFLGSIVVLTIQMPAGAIAATVTVDGAAPRQIIEGWHTQERVWSDPHLFQDNTDITGGCPPTQESMPFRRSCIVVPLSEQAAILGKLYGELKLTHVEPLVDRGDLPDFGCPTCAYERRWKFNQSHIDWVQQARPFGLQKWTPTFFRPVSIDQNDAALYAELMMTKLRDWKAQGVEPAFVDVMNEPDGSGNTGSPQYVHDVVRELGRRLASEGFSTKILSPTTLGFGSGLAAYIPPLMDDLETRGYVGALTGHLYADDGTVDNCILVRNTWGPGTAANKPIWMAEYYLGPGGAAGNVFNYGMLMLRLLKDCEVALVDVEFPYLGGQAPANPLMLLNYDNSTNTYLGFQVNKLYYVFGQFSRFIEAGAVRVQTTSSEPSLGVTAFRANDKLTIVVVNDSSSAQNGVSFNLLALGGISSVSSVRTSDTESWAEQAPIVVNASTFSADFPPMSVTTLVGNVLGTVDAGVLGDGGDGGSRPGDGGNGSRDGGMQSDGGTTGSGCGCEIGGRPRPLSWGILFLVVLAAASGRRPR